MASMEWVLGSAFLGGVLMLVRAHRRNIARASSQGNHLRRAGDGPSPQNAALRASGTNAWMRHGGG